MNRLLNKQKNQNTFIFAMLVILLGYLSWCFFTISHIDVSFGHIGFVVSLIATLFYIMVIYISGKENIKVSHQFMVLSLIFFGVFSLLLVTEIIRKGVKNQSYWLILGLIWMVVFLWSFIYLYRYTTKKKVNLPFSKSLLCLLLFTSLLMIDSEAMQFKWDGLLYYDTCTRLDITSLSSMAVYGHIAQTYGLLNGIVNLIVGNTAFSMMIVNCIFMLLSVCSFYGVLKLLLPEKKEWVYFVGTAVYAWSPFLLGMVHYYNLDFICQCMFPMVLLFYLKRQWVYFAVTSILFCFTKEPAIVVYVCLCLGILIVDVINDKKNNFTQRIKNIFFRKEYYVMFLCGILWLFTYLLLGPWSAGAGSFSIDLGYVWEKLKVLYLFQFNWVFTFVIISGILLLIKKHEMKKLLCVLPLMIAQIGFTVFSCLFKTVNHPRYVDTNEVILYIIAIVVLFEYKDYFRNAILMVFPVCMLLSSFYTIDPISKMIFPVYNIGETEMVTTSYEVPLGDAMIYNRQMLYMEQAINMAIKDSLEESNIIVFPTLNKNAYFFDGMTEVGNISANYRCDKEFFDNKNKKRVLNNRDNNQNNLKEFYVYQMTSLTGFQELLQKTHGKLNCIYSPQLDPLNWDELGANHMITEQKQYHNKGFSIERVCIDLNILNENVE